MTSTALNVVRSLEAHRRDVLERIATLTEAVAILDLEIDDYRIWEQQQ